MKKDEFEQKMDDVKKQIKAIQEGVAKLRLTGINEKVLYLLIQKASPNCGRFGQTPIPTKTIKAILKGIDGLYNYVFSPQSE